MDRLRCKKPTFEVRRAAANDAAEIAGVHVRSWQKAYRGQIPDDVLDSLDESRRAARWVELIAQPGHVLQVAVRDGGVVGFCSLIRSRDPASAGDTGEIAALYVHPEHWRSGVGAALPTSPPSRRPLESSAEAIQQFTARHDRWVIEGCYSDLLRLVAAECTQLIFLNPGVEACVQNCRSRPWEPNKYESQAAQDANLEMLIEWVVAYETRQDELSHQAHRRFFDAFPGAKIEIERETLA